MKVYSWILVKSFNGEPKNENMKLVEEELSEDLKDNEILMEAAYLSVDPYMKPFSSKRQTPFVMFGEQLARVIKTKNSKFPVGSLVLADSGWKSHWISKGDDLNQISFKLDNIPPSYCLGVLGMTGATAYFGLYKLLEPKKGETVIINGAAGAVGSIAGQLAKIKGCKVIAFVGSEDKLKFCKDELGFDHVFNYKKIDFCEAISKVAPDGAEMFFDNVGGNYYHKIINNNHMKQRGRILICGSIENYNDEEPKLYPATNWSILQKELKIQAIQVSTYKKDWPIAFVEMKKYIQEGKLKVHETTYEGFDKMRDAFYGLFKGENTGKAIVKITK